MHLLHYFFFQAEDGIRDGHVTGVQTCALPISSRPCSAPGDPGRERLGQPGRPSSLEGGDVGLVAQGQADIVQARSEERRVGKENRTQRIRNRKMKRNWKKRTKLIRHEK